MGDLVKELRACLPEDREKLAVQLARSGSEDAVPELIRMVEGKRRRVLAHYEFEDQLIGIRALGETGKQEALDYIEWLTKETRGLPIDLSSRTAHREGGDYLFATHEKVEVHYPNAKGELRTALDYYEEAFFEVDNVRGAGPPSRHMIKERNSKDHRIHGVVAAAVQKLKDDLGDR